MKNFEIFIVVVLFYVGWFGSAFLAQTTYSSLSLIFPLVLIGFLILRKHLQIQGFAFALGIFSIGIAFDYSMLLFGFIQTQTQTLFSMPIWLISIWLLFSFSMIRLGNQLRPPIWLAALLGFIMGPLSYKSGEVFHILSFSSQNTFLIYAIFWAMLFPAILILAKRFA